MSGFISKTSQKWKEYRGANITKDEEIEIHKQQINENHQYFEALETAFQNLSCLYSQMSQYYTYIGQLLNKIYASEKNNQYFQKQGQDITMIFTKLGDYYKEKVQPINEIPNYLKDWFLIFKDLRNRMDTYHDKRLVYDHYQEKVEGLKKKLFSQKGIGENQNNTQFQRNQVKLNDAQKEFQQIQQQIKEKMERMLDGKMKMVSSCVNNFLLNNVELYSNCLTQLKQKEGVAKHPVALEQQQQSQNSNERKNQIFEQLIAETDVSISLFSFQFDQQQRNKEINLEKPNQSPNQNNKTRPMSKSINSANSGKQISPNNSQINNQQKPQNQQPSQSNNPQQQDPFSQYNFNEVNSISQDQAYNQHPYSQQHQQQSKQMPPQQLQQMHATQKLDKSREQPLPARSNNPFLNEE